GQALVHQDRPFVHVHAAPVGAAVALALRQVQRLPAQALQVIARLQAEDAEDRTHVKLLTGHGTGARARKNPHLAMRVPWPVAFPEDYAWLQPAFRAR